MIVGPSSYFHRATKRACLFLAVLSAGAAFSLSAPAWSVKDAPYRASFRMKAAPANPDAGILLELPEFGQTRADAGDLLLTDSAGVPQPVAIVYSRAGSTALLLAKMMKGGGDYFVYCGGGKSRGGQNWSPKTSLFLETRPVDPAQHCESWGEMDSLWHRTQEKNDAGFVEKIFHGENPFGLDAGFMSHYAGFITPPAGNTVELFTASADASFVLVNDRFEFGWPGKHSGGVMPDKLRGKAVPCGNGPMKIDYYQIKGNDDYKPAMVLGWKTAGVPATIPPEGWLHPGTSELVQFEEISGQPVPDIKSSVKSYLGYGGEWFYRTEYTLRRDPPAGWNVSWQFDDGVIVQAARGARILTGANPQLITVRLTHEGTTISGIDCVHFPNELSRVNLEQPKSTDEYVRLATADDPATMKPDAARARVILLIDFGTDEEVAKFAPVWLAADPGFSNPVTIRVFNALVRAQAEIDPRKAFETLRAVPTGVRDRFGEALGRLEIDLLVFYLRDPNAETRATQLSFSKSNTETGRLMLVRAGDAARIQGRYDEANARYQKVNTRREEPAKAAAQDQAYSMTIASLLEEEHREEAAAKLTEWEVTHPQAKLTTDCLLLSARVAMSFGRWHQAQTELESYARMVPESPYQIDTQFYLAQSLAGQKKTDEARSIWAKIAKDYPRSPLAEKSKELARGK